MKLEIVISCHYYQKRTNWFLSSLLQQDKNNWDVVVNVAYQRRTGDPETEILLDFFEKQGLNIKRTEYENTSELQYRGFVRNRAVRESTADYLFFADCDMVWHPQTLDWLYDIVKQDPTDLMMYSGRKSTDLVETNQLVDSVSYPCVIDNAYHTVDHKLHATLRRNIGAGFCQIASRKSIKKNNNGYYVEPHKNRDWGWHKMQKANSDKQFRKAMGKKRIDLPVFIHLQHVRDADTGTHIETQR